MINRGLQHRNEYDGNGDNNFVNAQTLAELRQFLRYRFEVAPVTVLQLTYSTLGVEALQQLGTVLRTDAGLNGFYWVD
ncbi:MAG: alpha/beta hydrolase [Synechococcales cyanobacterium M58_A2018_015]|nr:alpha/beta hydrolase [Synechococcales cyanobacterium M58_A2018_015]